MIDILKKYGALIILSIGLIGFSVVHKVLPEKKIALPNTIVVKNHTEYEDFNWLTKLIVNKGFGYDNVTIEYHYIPFKYESSPKDFYKLNGFIIKNISRDNHYFIFVSRFLNEVDHIKFLCHELFHLHQFESGRLIPLDVIGVDVIYDDTIYCGHVIPYALRPYEIDAFDSENATYRKIKQYLY